MFSGRLALVTGAGSGIGRSLALALARRGARLALVGRRPARLETVAAEVRTVGGEAVCLPCDVSDAVAVAGAYDALRERAGEPEILFLNAGIARPAIAQNLDAAEVRRTFDTNFFGALHWMERALPGMQKRNDGVVVAVSSLFAWKGFPGIAAYGASKAALASFFESARLDFKSTRIRFVTVFPLFVETEMSGFDPNRPRWLWSSADEAAERILRGVERGKAVVVFPWSMRLVLSVLRNLPEAWYIRLWRTASPST